LFFLALIPIFTKWVLEYPNEIVPVFSYDILFLLVNLSFVLLTKTVISDETFKKLHTKDHEIRHQDEPQDEKSITRLIVMTLIVFFLVIIAILIPKISIVLFIGFPIVSSLLNIVGKDKWIIGKILKRKK
jgi:uncharacterized membrane protein